MGMLDGWAKINFRKSDEVDEWLFVFFENYFTLDTIGIYLTADSKPIMQFPSVGCGPIRILKRIKRNPVMMEVVGESAGLVAGLINQARLEMLKTSEAWI